MVRKLSPGTHTVRIKKPKGGTRLAKVRVLKSGKWRFLKGKPRAKPSRKAAKGKRAAPRKTSRKSSSKGGRRMTKKNVHIAAVLGLLKALVFPFGSNIDRAMAGDWHGIMDATMAGLIGVNTQGEVNFGWLAEGALPIVMGVGGSVIASKVGLNRRIAQATAGIPLLDRIRI